MKRKKLFGIAPLFLVLACAADTNSPDFVARAFMNHVQQNEFEQAFQHVLPEDRSEFQSFEEDLSRMPPIPEEIKVVVEAGDYHGHFTVPNWSERARVDLVFRHDRWWVTE